MKDKMWFVKLYVACGVYDNIVIEADSYSEAEHFAREACLELANEYGYEDDVDYFGDHDTVGAEWDEESEEYLEEGTLEYTVCYLEEDNLSSLVGDELVKAKSYFE